MPSFLEEPCRISVWPWCFPRGHIKQSSFNFVISNLLWQNILRIYVYPGVRNTSLKLITNLYVYSEKFLVEICEHAFDMRIVFNPISYIIFDQDDFVISSSLQCFNTVVYGVTISINQPFDKPSLKPHELLPMKNKIHFFLKLPFQILKTRMPSIRLEWILDLFDSSHDLSFLYLKIVDYKHLLVSYLLFEIL